MPLRLGAVDELKWFFEQKAIAAANRDLAESERFRAACRAFEGPRFNALYRRWMEHGLVAFDALSSPSLADAVARGRGEVETYVLAHSYFQLQSMVGTA